MRILNLNNFYNFKSNVIGKNNFQTRPMQNLYASPSGDVVSFSAKKYSYETIVNPTNHCAYCGTKVYDEQQIDSLTKEMLSSKHDKLKGKVKSVVEKLEIAKYSQELSLAKRVQNEADVDYFNHLLELTANKPYMRCETVLDQVYGMNQEEAYEEISKHLKPLQRTIDHISPQNMNQDNNSSDINLVEACYCCNHDLKQGISFQEFYAMFPSIKKNMPEEKFQYAAVHFLDSSQDSVMKRMGAISVLNLFNRLNLQRNETQNELNSIDLRIKACNESISSAIEFSKEEIAQKEEKIAELETTLAEYKDDPEFQAMLKRITLQAQLDDVEGVLEKLSNKRGRITNNLVALEKGDKKKDMLKPKDREERIKTYNCILATLATQIKEQQISKSNLEKEITVIDEQFPPYEVVQQEKIKMDGLVNSHKSLKMNTFQIGEKEAYIEELKTQIAQLKEEISSIPVSDKKEDDFPVEIKKQHFDYLAYTSALQSLGNPNGGGSPTKSIINDAARVELARRIEEIENNPLTIIYKNELRRNSLRSQKEKADRALFDAQKQLVEYKKVRESLLQTCSVMTQEEAEKKVEEFSAKLRSMNDKHNHIRIPEQIERLKSEIKLLNSTIEDLLKKQKEIQETYSS